MTSSGEEDPAGFTELGQPVGRLAPIAAVVGMGGTDEVAELALDGLTPGALAGAGQVEHGERPPHRVAMGVDRGGIDRDSGRTARPEPPREGESRTFEVPQAED